MSAYKLINYTYVQTHTHTVLWYYMLWFSGDFEFWHGATVLCTDHSAPTVTSVVCRDLVCNV